MKMLFLLILILQGLSSVTISVTLVGDPLAIQGQDYKLSCLKANISPSAEMDWYKDGIRYDAVLCSPLAGVCSPSEFDRYKFTIDKNGLYINITGLRRSEDQKQWKCTYKVEGSPLEEDTMNLTISTIPSGLIYTQAPPISSDLSLSAVRLECATSGCMYPVPVIKWYYKDASPPGLVTFYNQTATQTVGGNCTSPENVYSSRLELPLNTTWSDNSDKTLKFSCGIEYPKPLGTVYSPDSSAITFAIRVSWVEMHQNNLAVSDTILTVTSGEPVTLNCVTGTSRPDPTIVWFVENQSKGNEANLTFIPDGTDHYKMIYCRAYNTNPNLIVESAKLRMFVRVRVIEVSLQQNGHAILDGTVTVQSEEATTLTCGTGTSRPPATIEWYIGTQKMGNGINATFTPANKDHDMEIFCQAYNIDPSRPAVSMKPRLFVKVKVSNVTFWDSLSIVFYEGFPKTLKCISSPSRPVSSIRWWFESQSGTIQLTNNITNTEVPAINGLHVRISEITLILMKDSSDKRIFCDGNIDGQQTAAVSRTINVDVWYSPQVFIESRNGSYGEKGIMIKCSAYGVPEQYTFRLTHSSLFSGINIRQLNYEYVSSGVIIHQFNNPTFMDTGIYTCNVSNGIPDYRDGLMDTSANDTAWITDIPRVTSIDRSFYAEMGHSGRLVTEIFSSFLDPQVTWYKHNSGTLDKLQGSEKYNIILISTFVNVDFYSVHILQPGYIATLEIKNVTKDDFVSYQVHVQNSVGEMSPLILILKATASEPQGTSHNGPDGVLLGSVLGSAVLVSTVVAVVGVIVYRRRNKNIADHQSRKRSTSNEEHEFAQNSKIDEGHYQELEHTKDVVARHLIKSIILGSVDGNIRGVTDQDRNCVIDKHVRGAGCDIERQVDEKTQARSPTITVYETLTTDENIQEHEYNDLKNTSFSNVGKGLDQNTNIPKTRTVE